MLGQHWLWCSSLRRLVCHSDARMRGNAPSLARSRPFNTPPLYWVTDPFSTALLQHNFSFFFMAQNESFINLRLLYLHNSQQIPFKAFRYRVALVFITMRHPCTLRVSAYVLACPPPFFGNKFSLVSYLSKKVCSTQSVSEMVEVKFKVPQKLVLGPFLVLIMINELYIY